MDNLVCGPDASCFHVSSLFYHIINACLVFLFCLLIFQQKIVPAFFAALVFAVHPMNVEVVSWISARNHLVSTLFQLLSLISYYKFLTSRPAAPVRRNWFVSTYVFFVFAILSKSLAIIEPAVLLAMDWFSGRKDWRKALSEKILFVPPILAIVWATLHFRVITETPVPEVFVMTVWERILWGVRGVLFYVSRTFFPRDLTAYYDIHFVSVDGLDYLIFGALCAFMYWRRGDRVVRFGCLFFFLELLLVLKAVVPFGEYSIFNDRYNYLPMVGLLFCILSAPLAGGLTKRMAAVAFLLLTAGAGVVAEKQTHIWRNAESLWSDVIAKFPSTAMAHNNLCGYYVEGGEYAKGKIFCLKALEDRPDLAFPYYNLGVIADQEGQLAAALDFYRKAIQLRPVYPHAFNNFGSDYNILKKDRVTALQYFEKAIETGADFPEAYYNCSLIKYETGDPAGAKRALGTLVERWPNFVRAQILWARILVENGRPAEAVDHLRKAAQSTDEKLSQVAKEALQALHAE